ncbi:hypothetical protein BJ165DRAFT_537259 [Panaeolus papilionaceus]|nr:hypothetical protein BJ165DRAFT_537259 [Panaeolus papilionaceus]
MSASQKLTKKQKKGLAFRERKTGKPHRSSTSNTTAHSTSFSDNELDEMEAMAIPVMEDQDLADNDCYPTKIGRNEGQKRGKAGDHGAGGDAKPRKGAESSKGKRKSEEEDVPVSVEVSKEGGKGKKRKREGEENVGAKEADGESKNKTSKKIKTSKDGETTTDEKKNNGKSRFILFIGNLPYRITKESIAEHFAKCDPPPSVRLLTPKVPPGVQKPTKSKGCAFLEFTHKNAMQQGLKLHQSTLCGRMINVELTAGGGGKGEGRLQKLKERNQTLLKQREERLEKEAKDGKSFPNLPSKPQRFSTTSGLDHTPVTPKTWTVGDVEDGQTHRGSKRGKRPSKAKSNAKTWGTGVNAIPVG